MKMVVTLKNGVQLRIGVKEYTVRHHRYSGELTGLEYTYDDTPDGSALNWLDLTQVVAVHGERDAADGGKGDADPVTQGTWTEGGQDAERA